ncbi:MAG TPA: c-type cytochrome [Candidatus Azoamicus sp.]
MRVFYLIFSFVLFFSFSLSAESGKEIFDRYCTVCHSPAMAPMFGAPAAHDLNSWNDRKKMAFERAIEKNSSIANESGDKKESYSMNELLETAKMGTDKGMPPKGTCSDCTDDELTSVIKFMSSSE